MLPPHAKIIPTTRCRKWLGINFCLAAVLTLLPFAAAQPTWAQAAADPAVAAAGEALSPAAAAATTWYVDGSSGVNGNCNTAAAPCRDIQAAVDRAASGDTILVTGADSILYRFAGIGSCTRGYAVTAVVCIGAGKQLTLRGGYAPGNFTTSAPAQNPTILDGEDRAYGVFINGFSRVADTSLDIRGFVIRRGYGSGISNRTGPDTYFGYGGGMRVENVGSIRIQDMVFDANRAVGSNRTQGEGGAGAGGALALRAATAVLENVRFTNNQALGGAGETRGGYAQGGALYTYDTTLTGSKLLFDSNVARAGSSNGAGADATGRADGQGGAAVFMQQSRITLNDVTMRANQAIGGNAGREAGGAFGGGFFAEEAEVTIVVAEIRDNLAQGGTAANGWIGRGGGLSAIHSTVSIDRARILANTAHGGDGGSGVWGVPNGGGIGVTRDPGGAASNFTLTNSFVAGNKALRGGGSQIAYGGGGGLWIQGTDATLDHTTIADNELGAGEGLVGQGIVLPGASPNVPAASVTIRNTLITGHRGSRGAAVEAGAGNKTVLAGGIFFDNTDDTLGGIDGAATMETGDPRYISPGTAAFNYHIEADSPARDRARGSQLPFDIDGDPRSDGAPDFGADEYVVGGGNTDPGLPPGDFRLFLPGIFF